VIFVNDGKAKRSIVGVPFLRNGTSVNFDMIVVLKTLVSYVIIVTDGTLGIKS
jgi:hypothetical protein